MKTPLALLFLTLPLLTSAGEAPKPYTADWLRQGCAALIVFEQDRSNFSDNQRSFAFEVASWIRGFYSAVDSMSLASEKDIPPVSRLPGLDTFTTASKLIEFMRNSEPKIKKDAPAQKVMTAWYFSNHPEASRYNKFVASRILEEIQESEKEVRRATPVR